ncbi:enoyl-CoA hydratase [Stackebrandtia albiflava]|uniref:3-hydroxyisobutyryl-CoA hydrolase n=1 Tax=Stackebrandtia albiflava TaxID=406432 RepID=A0A562UL75_9ACTN|nr:enoyl-CoA hydratase/isomerase family protein [Stackebrandtia albiflava]TWJ06360.1 enoyl-CoA hydratase [Stackebrandtia albiflava]
MVTFSPSGPGDDEVLFARHGVLGRIRLHRPKAINALTLGMVTAMRTRLAEWAADDSVSAVVVDGAGDRGLCAGGDVRAIRDAVIEGTSAPEEFWRAEYALNRDIAEYPKPFVAVMDGVTMGGGVGVSAHGSVRLATERSKVAMPETAIGFFPDVGGLHLLSRAPGEAGTHMALTGLPVSGADAVYCGLADAVVPTVEVDGFLDRWADGEPVTVPDHPVPAADIAAAREWIDECYRGDDPVEILSRLRGRPEPAARRAADVLASRSPLSVTVTLRAIRRAATMTLPEVLAQDLRLGAAFATEPDFVEGVRAVLVDRDSPVWRHGDLTEVDRSEVDAMFG